LAERLGFSEEQRERVAIIASEFTSNVVKHAASGFLIAQACDDAEGAGIELIALDRGPGIRDLTRALQDGHSTAGSAGTGLGAAQRLADVFHVYSRPGNGTVALARITPRLETGCRAIACGLAQPLDGECECGDGYAWRENGMRASVLLADGLGHGPGAAAAASRAIEVFRAMGAISAQGSVEAVHARLRSTRGAAIAVAHLDIPRGKVDFSGIGNITGALVERGQTRRMLSDHGTAGHVAGRIRSLAYPFSTSPLLILHSDGLRSGWDLTTYPGLSEAHPALVAAVLLRDWKRGRDDASVIALRWRS
jgi:anti-sigma regulatory factor (Ser/Thr protein kinase)